MTAQMAQIHSPPIIIEAALPQKSQTILAMSSSFEKAANYAAPIPTMSRLDPETSLTAPISSPPSDSRGW